MLLLKNLFTDISFNNVKCLEISISISFPFVCCKHINKLVNTTTVQKVQKYDILYIGNQLSNFHKRG